METFGCVSLHTRRRHGDPKCQRTSLSTQMSKSAFCSKNRTLAANIKVQTCPTCAGRGLNQGQMVRPCRQTHRELKAHSLFPPTTNSLGAPGCVNCPWEIIAYWRTIVLTTLGGCSFRAFHCSDARATVHVILLQHQGSWGHLTRCCPLQHLLIIPGSSHSIVFVILHTFGIHHAPLRRLVLTWFSLTLYWSFV